MFPGGDPMATGFQFGLPEVEMVLLATAIISAIAAIRYRHRDPRSRVIGAAAPRLEPSQPATQDMRETKQ